MSDDVPEWLVPVRALIDGVPLFRLSDAMLRRLGEAVRIDPISRSCMTLSAWVHWRRRLLAELGVFPGRVTF